MTPPENFKPYENIPLVSYPQTKARDTATNQLSPDLGYSHPIFSEVRSEALSQLHLRSASA